VREQFFGVLMDIAIKKKKKVADYKWVIIAFLLLLPVFFAVKYLFYLGKADFGIERDSLVFSKVQRGAFSVTVRGTGVLVPDNIQWLSANVEATVAQVFLKAGNKVKQGDLIVELVNPQLVQQLAEAEWELEAVDAESKAAKVAQESDLQQQRSNVLNSKLDYEQSLNEYNAHNELIETGAVSRLSFQRSRIEMDQSKQRLSSNKEQLTKMEENSIAQESARVARLKQLKKRVERIQQQVTELKVRATMTGTIQEMPLQSGQRISMGTNLAKLAQQDSLIAELQVPEIQIRDVVVGQKVIIDTRNNKVEGVVSRVDPVVVNGNVQVDIEFTESIPDDARPDLSVDGLIVITEIKDALYADRPLFSQSRSQNKFYKVSEDGQFFERTDITTGYGSVNQIQILDGLSAGDEIVTSDPSRFEIYEKVRIK